MDWLESEMCRTKWEVKETKKTETDREKIESELTGKTLEEFKLFYESYILMLKTYPPKSPPYSIPLRNPTNPEIYEVYINRGFKLHIRARYVLADGICWIVQVKENA